MDSLLALYDFDTGKSDRQIIIDSNGCVRFSFTDGFVNWLVEVMCTIVG